MSQSPVSHFSAQTIRRVALLGGALVAAVALSMQLPAQEAGPGDRLSRALPVNTMEVEIKPGYMAKRSFTGRALPAQISPMAFEQGGTLAAVLVDLGDTVTAGQTLATLDLSRLKARKREIEAELEETRANHSLAERTLKRAKETFERGHSSAQRLDEAEANAIALRARERRLEAALETLAVDTDKATLKAPYDGVISARMMDTGTIVGAGVTVLELTETGPMEAHIGMPPEFAKAIASGSSVELYDGRRNRIEGAAVRGIVPVINGQTRTMLVTFDLPEGAVQRGELVNASVEDWQEQSGTWLPLRTLDADVRGLWRVYKVLDGNNGPHVRFENVQVIYTEGQNVFVTGTLSNGDKIIADGISRLAPGQRVEILPYGSGAPSLTAGAGF